MFVLQALAQQIPMNDLPLLNGWTNTAGTNWERMRYYSDPLGRVYIAGVAQAPNPFTGQTIALMPEGLRPGRDRHLPVFSHVDTGPPQWTHTAVVRATGVVQMWLVATGISGLLVFFDLSYRAGDPY